MRKWIIIFCVLLFGAFSFILIYETILKNSIHKLGIISQNIVEVVDIKENLEFDVRVHMTKGFSKSFLSKSLEKVYLEDDEQTTEVILINIVDLDETVEQYGVRYKVYKLSFQLITENKSVLWKFENATLRFAFTDQSEIAFDIGYVWLEKTELLDVNNVDLHITRLRGFSKIYNGKQTLGGLIIGIKNESEFEITIKDIFPKHDLLRLVYKNGFSIIKGIPVQHTDVDTYLGYSLNLNEALEDEPLQLVLQPNEEVQYFYPLTYIKDIQINQLGFEIKYEKQDHLNQMDKAPFLFFLETTSSSSDLVEMQTYKWSEFK